MVLIFEYSDEKSLQNFIKMELFHFLFLIELINKLISVIVILRLFQLSIEINYCFNNYNLLLLPYIYFNEVLANNLKNCLYVVGDFLGVVENSSHKVANEMGVSVSNEKLAYGG